MKKCKGCGRAIGKYPSLSRYGHGDICGGGPDGYVDNCGVKEAFEGDFISRKN